MQRPTSLTIIGWLLIVLAAFALIGQFMMQDNAMTQQMLAESPLPASVHLAVGLFGAAVSAASGYGILKALNWSRYLYLGWSIFALVFAFFTSPFTTVLLLSLVVIAIFGFFLFRPAANDWFAAGAQIASE